MAGRLHRIVGVLGLKRGAGCSAEAYGRCAGVVSPSAVCRAGAGCG